MLKYLFFLSFSTDGLFNGYINYYLKMKVEASGYPKDVVSEEQKDAYIQRYFEREGVRLEKEKIEKNPGMRSIAKLMLNSFWGKFGQRDNQVQTTVCKTNAEFITLICDQTKEISGIVFINSGAVQVQWRHLSHSSRGPATQTR